MAFSGKKQEEVEQYGNPVKTAGVLRTSGPFASPD